MSLRLLKLMKTYMPRDFMALKGIYDFRCLTFDQIFDLFYSKSIKTGKPITNEYAKKKIAKFKKDNIIEENFSTKGRSVYFLTTDGVTIVKEYFDLADNIYDYRKRLHVKGFLTSTELKVSTRFIEHQFHLNEFVINLTKMYQNVPYRYEDEKHIQSLVGIRPDGILSIFNTDFFLEMDMGTESKEQLIEKWDHYRRFYRSQEYALKERRIVVLFIVEGVKNVEERKNLIKNSIMHQISDIINIEFEFYINTPDKLIETVSKKIIPEEKGTFQLINVAKALFIKKFGYSIAAGHQMKNYFMDEIYPYFLFNRTSHSDAILTSCTFENLSAISHMEFFEAKRVAYLKKFNRNIPLIILLDDPKAFYNQIQVIDCILPNCVYFCTLETLNSATSFKDAIFQFGPKGDIYHITV